MASETSRESGKVPEKTAGEAAVLAKIAEMEAPYRAIAKRLHQIITENAPELTPRLWYGMPGYGNPCVCFFRVDGDYVTFGLTEKANLTREEGASHQLMPSAWFFTELDDATEAKLSAIVRQAAS